MHIFFSNIYNNASPNIRRPIIVDRKRRFVKLLVKLSELWTLAVDFSILIPWKIGMSVESSDFEIKLSAFSVPFTVDVSILESASYFQILNYINQNK